MKKHRFLALFMTLALLLTLFPAALAAPASAPTAPMVEAGGDSTFYVDENGTLWGWGDNSAGQLGVGDQKDRTVPVKIMEDVVSVSASPFHTVAVKTDGTLWGWGVSDCYQLGSDISTGVWSYRNLKIQTTPVKILDGVKTASAGMCCTLAIKTDGTLWSTGGLRYDADVPAMTIDTDGWVKLLDQAASCDGGDLGAAAVTPEGDVYLWGACEYEEKNPLPFHEPFKTVSDVRMLALGSGHDLVLTEAGEFYGHGQNDHGQIGPDDAAIQSSVQIRPGETGQVPGAKIAGELENISAIAAGSGSLGNGGAFSAAIDGNGALWLWGDGSRGQLGNGATEDSAQPVKALEDVAQVACGTNHVVALKKDGTIWVWGDGSQGQTGYRRTYWDASNQITAVPVEMELKATQSQTLNVLSGYAIDVDGTMVDHWSYQRENDPVSIPLSSLRSVAALLNGTAAQFDVTWDNADKSIHITTGQPYQARGNELTPPAAGAYTLWPSPYPLYVDGVRVALAGYVLDGNNYYTLNELCAILGVEFQMVDYHLSLRTRAGTSAVPMVEAGGDSTFYVDENGTLWGWGCNAGGQLGVGDQEDRTVPVKIMEDVVSVSTGTFHTVAVKTDGTLWGWGVSDAYRLGSDIGDGILRYTNRDLKVQTTPVKILDGVKTADAGMCCTLAIKTDGTLWSTGGLRMKDDGTEAVADTEGWIKLLDQAVACDGGDMNALAITPEGDVYMWGAWDWGGENVLGMPYHQPVKTAPGVRMAVLGGGHDLVITGEGAVYGHGRNDHGQIGPDGAGAEQAVQVAKELKNVSAIAAGNSSLGTGGAFSAAIDGDGTLWLWGDGSRGQLGNGAAEDSAQPVKALEDVAQVACGFNHVVALKKDGTIWCWGDGAHGQTGFQRMYWDPSNQIAAVPVEMELAADESQTVTVFSGYAIDVDGAMVDHWSYQRENDPVSIPWSSLRGLAAMLNGTDAQFNVTWEKIDKSIHITTGQPYQATGTELTPPAQGTYTLRPSPYPVYVDGVRVALAGYVLDGNNYYTLNELCAVLGVEFQLAVTQEAQLRLCTRPDRYAAAVADARTVEPEEVLPLTVPAIVEKGDHAGKIVVCTWNDTPERYPEGETVEIQDTVWVVGAYELEGWYAGHADELADPELRLAQLLGMPADTDFTTMTTMYVDPADLYRPAYDPDITKSTMTTTLTGPDWFQDWFKENEATTYDSDPGYPWTRLGYTYDWADNGTEYGLAEYILRPGTQVEVYRTLTTADFIEALASLVSARNAQ